MKRKEKILTLSPADDMISEFEGNIYLLQNKYEPDNNKILS